jgi:hypothetical protein
LPYFQENNMASRTKRKPADVEAFKKNAIEHLRKIIPHGSTIYTVTRFISRNGTGRVVAPLIVVNGEVRNISVEVSDALDRSWDDRGGGGVWAGNEFDLVHKLSYALHGEVGKGRQKNADCSQAEKATANSFKAGYSLVQKTL